MSYDLGVMMIERDRKRATHLLRQTPSIGKSTTYNIASTHDDEQHALGQFEPDWSKFEAVYAKDLLPHTEDIHSPPVDASEEKNQKSSRPEQSRNHVEVMGNGSRPVKDRLHSACDKANRKIALSVAQADGRSKKLGPDTKWLVVSGKSLRKIPADQGSDGKNCPMSSSHTETSVNPGSARVITLGSMKAAASPGQKHRLSDEDDNKLALQSTSQTDSQVKTSSFLLAVVDILLDYIRKSNDRSCKVLDFHHPHTLKEMMSHCLDITEDPQNLEQILSDCKETLKYCVKTGHPRFFNQLSTGLDIIALAGEWLTSTANTNMFTYEIAPVFTLIEDIVLTKMREHVGWSNGEGDGIFAPGGAISNLYAVAVARHKAVPECKTKGMSGMQRLVMFTSDQSHFSIKRAGAILGIGTDNVIYVKSDERGKMIVSDLEQQIEKAKAEGARPFFVSATTGTTVLGAFDPLNEIADVCEKHKLWFHVDGAWGCGLLLSKKHKGLLDGIHKADSVTWNPHKLMGALLQCSAILIKEKGLLEACNSSNATYLFQQDKHYDVTYDTGDKAIQCGRHNDVFKLWLMWRAKGETGFEKQVDRLMDLSRYLLKRISEREGFELILHNPEFLNVCFWYIPKNLRHLPHNRERDEKLHKVAPKIKSMMMERGTTMVGYQPLGTRPNFFRMIVSNPASTAQDIDFLISEIEKLGEEI